MALAAISHVSILECGYITVRAMSAPAFDKFLGCLLGLAVGDALGAPVEGWTSDAITSKYGRLTEMIGSEQRRLQPGETTDDTAMMLCIARSIVAAGTFDPKEVAQQFVHWFRTDGSGIGRTTYTAVSLLEQGYSWQEAGLIAHSVLGTNSATNGSIMRCAPVALLHWNDRQRLIADSITSSLITHADPRSCWAAAALNLIIAALLTGQDARAMIYDVVTQIDHSDVRHCLVNARSLHQSQLTPSGLALDTLQVALWCFLNTSDFEQAVVTAVNLGGDTDTVGAVCGAMAGAYYGAEAIPQRWLNVLRDRDDVEKCALGIYRIARLLSMDELSG